MKPVHETRRMATRGLVAILFAFGLWGGIPGISPGQGDGLFTGSGNSWETYDDGSDGDATDGFIHRQAAYSRDFGEDASVTIKHVIVMSGASGLSGANGKWYPQDPGGPNGGDGEDGDDGYSFNIRANTVTFLPTNYPDIYSHNHYWSGLATDGGGGGSGGSAGGWVVYGSGECPQPTVTRGTPGAAGNGGNGGDISIEARSVSFVQICTIAPNGYTSIYWKPSVSASGGAGGSAGNPSGLSPVGFAGLAGGDGGDGGAISFGKADIYMCPQPQSLYTLSCPPENGACNVSPAADYCEEIEMTSALGYMRLPVSTNGGNGGNGGYGGPAYDIFAGGFVSCPQSLPEMCSVTGPSGGDGGNGGDGGSLTACAIHPILYAAKGGDGGNGGAGGSSVDWVNYMYSSNGGDGGAPGEGGSAGSGCGALSESPDGTPGYTGIGAHVLHWEGCTECCAEGSPDPANPPPTPTPVPPPDIDLGNPIPGCGVRLSGMESGATIERNSPSYAGSIARGANLDEWEGDLSLYLKKTGYNQQIYIQDAWEVTCYNDRLKFWVNKNGNGTPITWPPVGVYDLFLVKDNCDSTLVGAVTITECDAGSNCACPSPVVCDSDGYLAMSTGAEKLPCFTGQDVNARWLTITIPAHTEMTFDLVDEDFNWYAGIGIYSACGGSLLSSVCETDGYASRTYANNTSSAVNLKILVNVHSSANPPYYNIECDPIPPELGSACAYPQPASCGSIFSYSGNPYGAPQIPGFGLEALPISCAATRSRWLQISVPANQELTVRVDETDTVVLGIAFYSSCGGYPSSPIDSICGSEDVSLSYVNATGSPVTLYVQVNDHWAANHPTIRFTCGPIIPENDDKCSPSSITCGQTITGSLTRYATDGGGGLCGFNGPDVWYEAVIPYAGTCVNATFNHGTTAGSVGIYAGANCNSLTLLDCGLSISYPTPATASCLTTENNQHLWIQIKATYYLAQSLTLDCGTAGSSCAFAYPANCGDVFFRQGKDEDPIYIPGSGYDELPCSDPGADLRGYWLEVAVPAGEELRVDLIDYDFSYWVGIGFYTSCGVNPIDCVFESDGEVSLTYPNLSAYPVTLKVLINVHVSANPPDIEFSCTTLTPDECEGAETLSNGVPIYFAQHLDGSTVSSEPYPGCEAVTPVMDVWYKFTPGLYKDVTITMYADLPDTAFVVYSGDCSNLELVGCSVGDTWSETFEFTSHQTEELDYYVRLYSGSSMTPGGELTAEWVTPSIPAGDTPDRAIPLANPCGYMETGNLMTGMTASGEASDCFPSGLRDRWYVFDSPATETGINVYYWQLLENPIPPPRGVAIYTGTPTNLVEKNCSTYCYTSYVTAAPGQKIFVRIGTTYNGSDQRIGISCFDKLGWGSY